MTTLSKIMTAPTIGHPWNPDQGDALDVCHHWTDAKSVAAEANG